MNQRKNIFLTCITLFGIHSALVAVFTNYLHQHCWGYYQLYAHNLASARKFFNNASANTPQYEKFTLIGQVELLFEQKEYKKIIELYKKHAAFFDKKVSLKKIYALSLAKTGCTQKSDAVFIALNKQHPTETEIAFYAINAYINNKDLHNALNAIAILLAQNNNVQHLFIFYFLQAQIYMKMNDLVQAKAATQMALKCNPDFDKGWLLFSILAEKEGAWDEAVTGYKTFLALQSSTEPNDQIQKHVLELVLAQEKSINQRHAPNHLLERFNEAVLHVKNKNYNQALICINHCIQKEPNNKTYALLKIEILVALNQLHELADYCQYHIDQNKADDFWYKIVHRIACKEKSFTPYVISLLEKISAQSHNVIASLYLADIHIQQKEWEKASKIFEQLTDHIQDNDLACTTMHKLATMYFIQKKYDKAIITLKKNLSHHSNHVASLNLLAYIYIVKKELDKAEKFIAKARALDIENPHLMDTFALLYYEREQYEEAKKLLDKALKAAPKDATIILHRAQIAYQEHDFAYAQKLATLAKKEAFYDHEHHMAEEFNTKWFPRR
ncbi:MAG TPA: tetratricopeptide repeat protein [Patescibacteria group bacterium]|jgi:tetratricopeptide (TPR) repeat protein|nr:tetratricopeptide repeat protein [Patescibacteria group bacterium]